MKKVKHKCALLESIDPWRKSFLPYFGVAYIWVRRLLKQEKNVELDFILSRRLSVLFELLSRYFDVIHRKIRMCKDKSFTINTAIYHNSMKKKSSPFWSSSPFHCTKGYLDLFSESFLGGTKNGSSMTSSLQKKLYILWILLFLRE